MQIKLFFNGLMLAALCVQLPTTAVIKEIYADKIIF